MGGSASTTTTRAWEMTMTCLPLRKWTALLTRRPRWRRSIEFRRGRESPAGSGADGAGVGSLVSALLFLQPEGVVGSAPTISTQSTRPGIDTQNRDQAVTPSCTVVLSATCTKK